MLNGRQIRTKIDTLLPSPAHKAQEQQARQATKSQTVTKVEYSYQVGSPCYALYCGPRRNKEPRWVAATVTKVYGSRNVNVRVYPNGPTWRRHMDQLRPRYGVEHDSEPGIDIDEATTDQCVPTIQEPRKQQKPRRNPRMPDGKEYGRHNLRRSPRNKPVMG